MALDGNPSLEDIDANAFINIGPLFDEFDPETFFNGDNFLGKPLEMQIHESIDSMFRYGSIIFEDNVGLRERLPLTGNEIITVVYKNKITGDLETVPYYKIIHFNIFDMVEVQARPNSAKDNRFQRKGLKFSIIEAPFYLKYNMSAISKIFGKDYGNGKIEAPTIDKIFENILLDILKINDDFVNLDLSPMSKETFYVSCPSWKAQKFFKYLLKYARDEDGFGSVKFFNTSNPYTGLTTVNLKSMLGMFKNPRDNIIHQYTLVDVAPFDTSIRSEGQGLRPRSLNQIYFYKFLTYDLSSLTLGVGGASLNNYSYIGNTGYYNLYENYENVLDNDAHFSNFGIWNRSISNSNTKGYYLGSMPRNVAKSYLNNRVTDHNFQIRCETLCVLNEQVNVGDVIGISFLSTSPNILEGQNQILDEQMSGGWLVEEITDIYSNGKGQRKMVLVKDSYFNIFNPTSSDRQIVLPEVKSVLAEDSGDSNDTNRRNIGGPSIFDDSRFLRELGRLD